MQCLIKKFFNNFYLKIIFIEFLCSAIYKHTSLLLHQFDFLSSGTFHASFTLIINVTLS